VNRDHLPVWEGHLEDERQAMRGVVCTEAWPLENHEALCVNTRCTALMIGQRAVLVFRDAPLIDRPVVLQFAVRLPNYSPEARASISLPEGMVLVSGRLEWHGRLDPGEDHILEAVVRVTRPGYLSVTGTVVADSEGAARRLEDTVYLEVTDSGVLFGSRPVNDWDTGYAYALPLPQNDHVISSRLMVFPEPQLGHEFTMTLRVTPTLSLTGPQRPQIGLAFPAGGLEVIRVWYPDGGDTYSSSAQISWTGDVCAGQSVEIGATLGAVGSGWGTVYGSLHAQPGDEFPDLIVAVGLAELYVDRYGGCAAVRDTPADGCSRGGEPCGEP
jgi:hypothetical protein